MSDGGVSKTLNNRATDADHVPCVLVYGFDWQEERNIGGGGWYMKECAKTISTTKPGAVLVLNDQGGA